MGAPPPPPPPPPKGIVLSPFQSENGCTLSAQFGLESGMDFQRTTGNSTRIYRFN